MKYINTKTKAIVISDSLISGGDWIPLEEKKESKRKKATSNKKSGD